MKLRFFIVGCLALLNVNSFAATDDPIIMNIAGQKITRSEFEYALNKNSSGQKTTDQHAIEEYADMFVTFKLKVKSALDAKLDTMPAVKAEMEQYQMSQLKSRIIDKDHLDSLAHVVYNNAKKDLNGRKLYKISHILVAVPKKATDAQKAALKNRADSIYQALVKGADFATTAKKCSNDFKSAVNGGRMPEVWPRMTLPEFEQQLYTMKAGDLSKPFLTRVGYHIVKVFESKDLEPFEVRQAEIMTVLQNNGAEEEALEVGLRKYQKKYLCGPQEVMGKIEAEAVAEAPELKYLLQEYKDGVLSFAITENIDTKAAKDTAGLKKYYEEHLDSFKWKTPRYKGYLIQTNNAQSLKEIKEFLTPYKTDMKGLELLKRTKKYPLGKNNLILFNIFKKGENPLVDEKAFGKKTVSHKRHLQYYDVVGSMINAPESYIDDRAAITTAYQKYKEDEWLGQLRKKYSVEIDKKVMNTVNRH